MRNTVFIHTNPKQAVGALVARHALLRNSKAPERFDVRILDTTDFPAFARWEGRSYLREGKQAVWRNDDLQSFTPLRFAVPELMGYEGRAVLAVTAVLVAAAPALAHDNGEGWWGETNDRVVTNAGFILIVFFPLFIFIVSMIQWRLEKRKYARQAAAKRAAQSQGGW